MTMTATTYEPGTLYHVDPGQLLLQRNIREATPSADLIASVKEVGVLEPITAVLNQDGQLVVRYGHRRTMAALEAGGILVPVYVAALDDMSDRAEVERITCQRDENTHRVGLSAADEVGIVEQLAAFGLSAAQIASQARVKKENVDTALAVSGSKFAKKAAARYTDLTLDQAAAVAEFEADPETAKELLVTALEDPHRFPHAVQRKRDDRARAEEKAAKIAELEAAGVTVIDPPGYDGKAKALYSLADPKTGKELTPAKHKSCPGHVAWVYGYTPTPQYGCSDPKKHGHRVNSGYSDGGSSAASELSEAEREQAKKDRRLVIENNKAWDSATTVRRDWLALFAKMKTAPKGTAAFIATAIAEDLQNLLDYQANDLATQWLGVQDRAGLKKAAAAATEARALHIALVQVLGRYESKTDRMDWRRNGTGSATGRYLSFLGACGYPLSEVEQFAISKKTV